MSAQFITIEGLEGAGKTTQAEVLCNWLTDRGISFVRTREPGGTPIAEKIRDLVLAHHDERMDPYTELLMVFAARQQHVETLIKPALVNGQWVVSDRFTDATYAYQGGGRSLGANYIQQLEQLVLGGFQPDTTFWFDCDAQTGLNRARARGSLDRIEQEALSFFNRARAAYEQRALQQPQRFVRLDASQTVEAVSEQLIQALEARYA
ncbi:dTMP kinase [Reinekea blandensis]|uniref:Thymidylate kinase n=1 Tax=Reinekea blandensis MED297 TaxID=314283 RepID=A4BDY8_9GAMM|nr:dTMP kinase [Reinekea blandensis]EAR09747.1 Thymidylate kinase [Reinekea blandensis MED297]